LPNALSKRLQKNIVNDEYREGEYDNVSSHYFYSLQNALFYSSGFHHEFCSHETLEKVSKTTRIIFITTAQDQELGFASRESMETLKNLGHDIILLTDQDHFFIKNPEIQEILWKFLE
jgi:queuine/archaeosine tRNA-ribosyltransferase